VTTTSTIYLCGDTKKAQSLDLTKASRVCVIDQLSHNYADCAWKVIDLGRVPLLVHGVGIFYRRFFGQGVSSFKRISADHDFQSLTESDKPGSAHRTGIYLSKVERRDKSGDLHFNLLRCSSNLSGPTDNFSANDKHIVAALNVEAASTFQNQAPLNHVLAQIYVNTPADGKTKKKQTKAKIRAHADKTKDMPSNAIMAFCTFYDHLDRLQPVGAFDYGFKGKRGTFRNTKIGPKFVSGLTKLHFRLKPAVAAKQGCTLTPQFSVTLYPDSVFFIPLSTNRLYTHEIRPSALNAEHIPTRLGYVVRCSSTEAVFRNGHTFLKTMEQKKPALLKLEPPTSQGVAAVKSLYAQENSSDAIINYNHPIPFSMNKGDYTQPLLNQADNFHIFSLPVHSNSSEEVSYLFEELSTSVSWESMTKGRRAAVLLKQDEKRGSPIVRTTSKYSASAHQFRSVHLWLEKMITRIASESLLGSFAFNNALIERYTNAYTTMGFQSDQAHDL